jgi:transcription initiation factor TFIIIB Brf1 subunit/transcription initiation factor TFIIB
MTNSKSINLAKYTTKYSDFIERYCYRLNITKYANEILIFAQKVDELRILTKNRPQAVACGCIFFIATMYRLGITKMEIHNQCGPSIPTISKSYEKLVEHTQELI